MPTPGKPQANIKFTTGERGGGAPGNAVTNREHLADLLEFDLATVVHDLGLDDCRELRRRWRILLRSCEKGKGGWVHQSNQCAYHYCIVGPRALVCAASASTPAAGTCAGQKLISSRAHSGRGVTRQDYARRLWGKGRTGTGGGAQMAHASCRSDAGDASGRRPPQHA